MSTIGVVAVHSVAARMPTDVNFLDAPVRGSLPQAADGSLEIFVGASDADFVRVQPILQPFGTILHTGGPGTGAATKLVVNLALGVAVTALGEALNLGKDLSLPRNMLLDVLADSPLGGIVETKRANFETGSYTPSFKLRLASKDLELAIEAAPNNGRDLRVTRAARGWFDEAVARDLGDLDFSVIVPMILEETRSITHR